MDVTLVFVCHRVFTKPDLVFVSGTICLVLRHIYV